MRIGLAVSVVAVVVLASLGGVGVAATEPQAEGVPGPTASNRVPVTRAQAWQQDRVAGRDVASLQRRLGEHWRLIPLRDGVLLVPRRPAREFKGVEVRQGSIAIDGQVVSGEEVRARLGADADAVIAASYLEPAVLLRPAAPEPPPDAPDRTPQSAGAETQRAGRPAADRAPMRHRSARVSLGRDLVVEENERVDDAAVAVFGSVTVNGEVNGDVVAVLGDVRVGPRASVRGNLTAVGGSVITDPAARLYGGSNEVAIRVPHINVKIPEISSPVAWWPAHHWRAGLASAWTAFRLALVALLALALALIARGPIERMRLHLRAAPLATTLVGVAAHVLLVPAIIAIALLLLVSIVGIPLLALLPFALLAGGVLWTIGFAAVAELVGEAVGARGRPLLSLVAGLAVIWAITVIARLAGWGGGLFVGTLAVLGLAVEFVAWSAALGAVILGWRRRPATRESVYTPVPPVPSAPLEF